MKTEFISAKVSFRTVFVLCFLLIPILSLSITGCSKNKIKLGKSQVKLPDTNKVIVTETGVFPVNQILVVLKGGRGKNDAGSIAEQYKGTVVGELEFINLFQIETGFTKEEELKKALSEISGKEGVLYALPNSSLKLRSGTLISCDPLDDPCYQNDKKAYTAFEMMKLKEAWKLIRASGLSLSDVNVGVNDDEIGVLTKELNIKGPEGSDEKMKEWMKKGIIMNSEIKAGTMQEGLLKSGGRHANNVTNIIAANNKNGGISGVASILGEKLNVNHINTFRSTGAGFKETEEYDPKDIKQIQLNGKAYVNTFLADLQKQVENGAQVINCSFGTSSYKDVEGPKAFKRFIEKMSKEHPDVVFVGAGGNDDHEVTGDNDMWGSKSPNLLTVGFINEDGSKNQHSNYAAGDGEITISTYGEMLMEDGGMNYGSSYSAPQVTGVVALMKSLNPKLSAAEIKNILTKTATKDFNGNKIDPRMGAGCLNAEDAVFSVIKDLKKDESLTKESLLNLASLELTAKGGPREFTVTASVKSVSAKGTKFSIDISGSNFVLNGSKEQKLSAAGSVSWDISLGEESKGVTVTVKRLDTDGCAIIFLSSMPEVSLSGKATGFLDPGDEPKSHAFNVIEGSADLKVNGSGDAVFTFSYKTETINRSGSSDPKYAILDYFSGVGTLTGNVDFYKGAGFELTGTINGTTHNVETHGVPNKLGDRTTPFPVSAKFNFSEINKDSKKVVLKCEITHPGRKRGDFKIYSDLEGSCDVSLISKK